MTLTNSPVFGMYATKLSANTINLLLNPRPCEEEPGEDEEAGGGEGQGELAGPPAHGLLHCTIGSTRDGQ